MSRERTLQILAAMAAEWPTAAQIAQVLRGTGEAPPSASGHAVGVLLADLHGSGYAVHDNSKPRRWYPTPAGRDLLRDRQACARLIEAA